MSYRATPDKDFNHGLLALASAVGIGVVLLAFILYQSLSQQHVIIDLLGIDGGVTSSIHTTMDRVRIEGPAQIQVEDMTYLTRFSIRPDPDFSH